MNINGPDQGAPVKGLENKEELKLRISVADDDPTVLGVTRRLLERIGHIVDTVANGQLLLDKLASGEKYDLVIIDREMPVMGGIEALKKIRELYGNLPVIVATSGAESEDIETIENLGGEYLEKPFRPKQLYNAVKKMTENKPVQETGAVVDEKKVENKERLNLRILVAEDIPMSRRVIGERLTTLGHKAEIVENGQLLLEQLATGKKYDCIITDLEMPVMGGLDALRKIRGAGNSIPVIVYTSHSDPVLTRTIEELGAKYLDKTSMTIDSLKQAIEEVMESKA